MIVIADQRRLSPTGIAPDEERVIRARGQRQNRNRDRIAVHTQADGHRSGIENPIRTSHDAHRRVAEQAEITNAGRDGRSIGNSNRGTNA